MGNFSQPFMFSTLPECAFFKNDMRILVKVEFNSLTHSKVDSFVEET